MKYLAYLSIALAIIALGVVIFTPRTQTLGSASTNSFGSPVITVVTASSTTPTTTFSNYNANRRGFILRNSGGNDATCAFTATSTGLTFASGSVYLASTTGQFLDDGNFLYVGPIWCLTRTGTTQITVTEAK